MPPSEGSPAARDALGEDVLPPRTVRSSSFTPEFYSRTGAIEGPNIAIAIGPSPSSLPAFRVQLVCLKPGKFRTRSLMVTAASGAARRSLRDLIAAKRAAKAPPPAPECSSRGNGSSALSVSQAIARLSRSRQSFCEEGWSAPSAATAVEIPDIASVASWHAFARRFGLSCTTECAPEERPAAGGPYAKASRCEAVRKAICTDGYMELEPSWDTDSARLERTTAALDAALDALDAAGMPSIFLLAFDEVWDTVERLRMVVETALGRAVSETGTQKPSAELKKAATRIQARIRGRAARRAPRMSAVLEMALARQRLLNAHSPSRHAAEELGRQKRLHALETALALQRELELEAELEQARQKEEALRKHKEKKEKEEKPPPPPPDDHDFIRYDFTYEFDVSTVRPGAAGWPMRREREGRGAKGAFESASGLPAHTTVWLALTEMSPKTSCMYDECLCALSVFECLCVPLRVSQCLSVYLSPSQCLSECLMTMHSP